MNKINRRSFVSLGSSLVAAGLTVPGACTLRTLNGEDEKGSVFEFRPVEVSCDDQGFTTWKLNDHSKDRFIYHVNDLENYQAAMTLALKNLLLKFAE